MAGINSKNVNNQSAGVETAEQLLLQKMEDNRRVLQQLDAVMEQKSAKLDKVQKEINELKKIYTDKGF